jgi:hypothetical protein
MSDSELDDEGSGRRWIERVADMFSGEPTSRPELMETLRYAADRDLIDVDVLNILFGAIAIADMHARDVMIRVHSSSASKRRNAAAVPADGDRVATFAFSGDRRRRRRRARHPAREDILPLLLKDEGRFRHQGLHAPRSGHSEASGSTCCCRISARIAITWPLSSTSTATSAVR